MRRTVIAAALAAAGLIWTYAGANAQSVYRPDADVDTEFYEAPAEDVAPKPTAPRVYGYYRDDGVELDRPSGPNGCGTYFYWNGERCVDARLK